MRKLLILALCAFVGILGMRRWKIVREVTRESSDFKVV